MYTIFYRSILWPPYDDDEIWIPNFFSKKETFDPFFFFLFLNWLTTTTIIIMNTYRLSSTNAASTRNGKIDRILP